MIVFGIIVLVLVILLIIWAFWTNPFEFLFNAAAYIFGELIGSFLEDLF